MQLSNPVLLIKLKELNDIETDDEFSLNEEIEKLDLDEELEELEDEPMVKEVVR